MKITFSIPAECTIDAQKKLLDALRKELLDLAFVELKNELLILELAPCADPIDATEKTLSVARENGIELTRVQGKQEEPPVKENSPRVPEVQMFGKKPVRVVKMSQYVISLIATALICSLLMFSLGAIVFSDPADAFESTLGTGEQAGEDYAAKIGLIDSIFDQYALYDTDGKLLLDEMLRAYMAASGDKYAAYYTAEEYEALLADLQGEAVGIGVTVTMDPDSGNICVLQVAPGSPAEAADVRPGDRITVIGTLAEGERVSEIGYDLAMKKMMGEAGSTATFVVLRDGREIEKSAVRAKFTAVSVQGYVSASDARVGILRISGFDTSTPTQFKSTMGTLLAAGCTHFVYDVRNNPGGELKSVCAVLSYFANAGDVLVSTVEKSGTTTHYKAQPVTYTEDMAACSVTEEEIGMYRAYPAVVLANGYTASAGELFTAALSDFGLAAVVGENTYGKGVVQSIFNLSAIAPQFGTQLSGALKLTVAYYTPPSGTNYDGVGIAPDVAVPLDPALSGKNLYLLEESEDNQLLAAIQEVLKK